MSIVLNSLSYFIFIMADIMYLLRICLENINNNVNTIIRKYVLCKNMYYLFNRFLFLAKVLAI